jgi:dTMP kinase
MPHLTFWLDVDVETARKRIAARHKAMAPTAMGAAESRIDEDAQDFHERVREGYQAIAKQHPQRIVRIDAAKSIEAVQAEVWQKLSERYGI